ncbi:hypothetical protein BKA63DRAFT_515577 [Paraphoma chrysanthemicola]|nr:hypothetical protein BKA63DRAFT_515577 [Paraphoma chrysanthemicola]
MSDFIRAPREFFRVEDASSRASYIEGKGIYAEDDYTWVDFDSTGARLFAQIGQHLQWANKHPTPFISAYSDEDVAWREAERRCLDGKKDVRIYTINTNRRGKAIEYRNIRRLAKKVGLWIDDQAWNNSKYEYIFLHHIPKSMIVGTFKL